MSQRLNVRYKSYAVMRLVSQIYTFMGILTFGLTLLAALVLVLGGLTSLTTLNDLNRNAVPISLVGVLLSAGATLLTGFMMALAMLFISQLIQVFLELIDNSRYQTEFLRRLAMERGDSRQIFGA